MPRIKQSGRGWAYTGAILGGLVSIAANVAHSFLPPRDAPQTWAPEPGAVVGAIVWPVFLFIAVEILARTSWPRGWSWGLLRWAGLLPVAGVAAFVSYRHLSGLLAHYGEEAIVYYIGPLAVDGLMIMATGALLAGGRAARSSAAVRVESAPAPQPTTTPHPVAPAALPPVTRPPAAPPVPAPPRPVQTPAPLPTPAKAPARSEPRKRPAAAAASPAPSTTDTPVIALDAGPGKSQLAPGLLARGRFLVEAHRTSTGNEINAGELAVKLRVSTDRAKQVLAALADSTATPAPAVNASRLTAATR